MRSNYDKSIITKGCIQSNETLKLQFELGFSDLDCLLFINLFVVVVFVVFSYGCLYA